MKFTLKISRAASAELQSVWTYNAEHRSVKQADTYGAFLLRGIQKLADEFNLGKQVDAEPTLRYITLKRRSKSDGHVIVYAVNQPSRQVEVLHIFHTKQDWQNKI